VLIVLTMAGIALYVGSGLPGDAQLPIHWNVEGQADGFAGKWQALLMPAGLATAMSLLFFFLPALEPRRQGLERSQGLYLWGWAALLLMSVMIEIVTVSAALGWDIAPDRLILGAVGVMLVMIGNQLGKSRSMYMVGIRTPWTLASEEVWIKTHRLGGKLMAIAGTVMLIAALIPMPSAPRIVVLAAVIGIAVLAPLVYSYLLWRREAADQSSGKRSTRE